MKNLSRCGKLIGFAVIFAAPLSAHAIPLLLGKVRPAPSVSGAAANSTFTVQQGGSSSAAPGAGDGSVAEMALYGKSFNDAGTGMPVFSFLGRHMAAARAGALASAAPSAAVTPFARVPAPDTLALVGLGLLALTSVTYARTRAAKHK